MVVFWLAKFLGAQDFGVFSLALAIVSVVSLLVRWGGETLMLKYLAPIRDRGRLYYRRVAMSIIKLVIRNVFFGVFLLQALQFINMRFNFIDEALMGALYKMMPLLFALSILPVLSSYYRSIGSPIMGLTVQSVLPIFLFFILFIVNKVGGVGLGIDNAVLSYSFSFFLIAVYFLARLTIKLKFKAVSRKKFVKLLYSRGRVFLLLSSASICMAWTDVFVLGAYVGYESVGLYGVVVKLSAGVTVLLLAANYVLASQYASWYKSGELRRVKLMVRLVSSVSMFFGFFALVFFYYYGRSLLEIVGMEYVVGYDALLILSFGQLVNMSCGQVGVILTMTDGQVAMLRITLISGILNLLLSIPLGISYGIEGVAIATSLSLIVWNILGVYAVKKELGFYTLPVTGLLKKEINR